jgi:hypothetical protein
MRLVFVLYAEDRDLLPSSGDPHLKQLWESGYSIKTLYARLLVDEALNPDTMDERRGGWGQLLAVFRLIHQGHQDWVTGRGGKLFDPNGFLFLEGRERGGGLADAKVLPVSDGTILRILHGPAAPPVRFGGRSRARSSRCEAAASSRNWVSVFLLCGPKARLHAPKSARADATGPRQGSQGSIPKTRRADPSNPRRRRRVSNRGTKRARSHTAWAKCDIAARCSRPHESYFGRQSALLVPGVVRL